MVHPAADESLFTMGETAACRVGTKKSISY
jgi:hypothetical protein